MKNSFNQNPSTPLSFSSPQTFSELGSSNFSHQPQSSKPKFFLIFLLALFIFFLGGLAIFAYFSLGKRPDLTADWKFYRNKEYGYEIKHPPNFILETDEPVDPLTFRVILMPEAPPFVQIESAINTNNLSLEDWVDRISKVAFREGYKSESAVWQLKDKQEFTLGGIKGIRGKYICCGAANDVVYVKKDDFIYSVSAIAPAPFTPDSLENFKSTFDLILKSFRFEIKKN